VAQPALLLYVKGGAAWVRDEFTETTSVAGLCPECPGSVKNNRSGWTVGGGFEYLFLPNWSVFVEYNYMNFGTKDETLIFTDGGPETYHIKQNLQAIQVGVNYCFNVLRWVSALWEIQSPGQCETVWKRNRLR
jgi:outer membrane immunogenic protein